jgi:hypothetical protein
MSLSIINQVIEQLSKMPQPLQNKVLHFAQQINQVRIQGVPGQTLVRYANSIPSDDIILMQSAIDQDCSQIDLDEW